MSAIVIASIVADIATLTRLVSTPVAPFGYGTDLRCVDDVLEQLDEVDPFSTLAIAEALARRLGTPRGSLQDDEEYGLDLRGYANRGTPITEFADLAGRVRNEVTKDDRVDAATVAISYSLVGLRVQIVILPVDANLGEFRLTFAVTTGAVLLEALS